MSMIRNRLDIVVGVRVEMLPGLPLVASALNHVEKMRDYAGLGEELAIRIEIDAPRIAGALGENLELILRGMIAPIARVDLRALRVGGAGLSDVGMGEDP